MTAVAHAFRADEADHIRREALTMGLYVSITLLAALTATGGEHDPELDVLAVVWGTTLGLAVAHWFAFGLARRLLDPEPGDDDDVNRLLLVEMLAAATVAAIASLPVLLLPDDLHRSGARFASASCIGYAAYALTRAGGATRGRAIRVTLLALVLAFTVAAVKHALTH